MFIYLLFYQPSIRKPTPPLAGTRLRKFGEAGPLSIGCEAKPLLEQALEICKKAHGNDHPSVANSLICLGNMLLTQGELDEARPMFERAIEINKKALGEDHVDIASPIWQLAALVMKQGDRDEGTRLWRQALAIYEKALGADHPTTTRCREWR